MLPLLNDFFTSFYCKSCLEKIALMRYDSPLMPGKTYSMCQWHDVKYFYGKTKANISYTSIFRTYSSLCYNVESRIILL